MPVIDMDVSTAMAMNVSMARSRHGTPEPQIQVRVPSGISFRRLQALLWRLAADVTLGTPDAESWVVAVDFARGRVYLELSTGTGAEARRGRDLLDGIVERVQEGTAPVRRRGGS